jgi:capsular exopolysaccharide synthesis family protein
VTLLTVGVSLTRDDVYSADAIVLVRAPESLFSTGQDDDEAIRVSTAITLLEGEEVAAEVREQLGLVDDPPSVSGAAIEDSNTLSVTVEADTPERAAELANAYAAALIEVRRSETVADLTNRADQLATQASTFDAQIVAVDAQLQDAQATTSETITARETEIGQLELQIAALQREQITLQVQSSLSIDQQVQVQTLGLQISSLQARVQGIRDEIDDLRADGSEQLRQERTRLTAQQAEFRSREAEIRIDASLATGSARIVQQATPPASPASPQPVKSGLVGLIAGLLLGMGVAFLRDYFDDSIKSPNDLDKLDREAPLLAVVPAVPTKNGRSVGIAQPGSLAIEGFRSLRTTVQFLGVDRQMRVLEVVSAQPDEGKTTVASNLAVVLSQAGNRVVLVDGDLRAPRVDRIFAVDKSRGLTDNLAGDSLDVTLQQVSPHLTVLVAGRTPENPSDLLSGKRMRAVLDELRLRFDYVVVDSAPVLSVSDGLTIAQYVDGVVVVARSSRTTVGPLDQALTMLEQVGAPVLGVVLNRVRPRDARADNYTYGSEYGKRPSGPSPTERPAPAPTISE